MATVKELESREKVCENKDFCNLIMLSKDNEILELNQYQKCHKALFVICTDLECVIEKIDRCKNNPENSSATRVSKHIPSGFSMSTILLFSIYYLLYQYFQCIYYINVIIQEHIEVLRIA